jgi:hypothetical protein
MIPRPPPHLTGQPLLHCGGGVRSPPQSPPLSRPPALSSPAAPHTLPPPPHLTSPDRATSPPLAAAGQPPLHGCGCDRSTSPPPHPPQHFTASTHLHIHAAPLTRSSIPTASPGYTRLHRLHPVTPTFPHLSPLFLRRNKFFLGQCFFLI